MPSGNSGRVRPGVEPLEARDLPARSDLVLINPLFQDLLDRPPTAAESSSAVSKIDSGTSIFCIAISVLTSTAGRSHQVRDAFQDLLHRTPSPRVQELFSRFLQAGGTLEQLRASLAGSLEYFRNRGGATNHGFLNALFQDALGRLPTPGERASHLRELAAGTTRQQIALKLFTSAGYYRRLVDEAFQEFLDRRPGPLELQRNVQALLTGTRDEVFFAKLTGLPEYFLNHFHPRRT